MAKWCYTCNRNEIAGEWRSCSDDCPAFAKSHDELAKIVVSIKEVLAKAEGIADNQEFGLSYSQAISYLEEIKKLLNG